MPYSREPQDGGGNTSASSETHTTYGTNLISNRSEPEEENQVEEAELKYGASHVIHLFVPVSLCMALVVFTMNTITFYSQNNGRHLLYTPFVKETDSIVEKGLMSLGNALVMLSVVIVMTVLLIFFYKYKFYKLIHGWLIISSFLLLFLFTAIYVQEVLKSFDVSPSVILVLFGLGNYGVLGMMCIHWKGPLRLQQFYLITMSALMALVFIKYLPEWTVWFVLFVISVWDLVAVLTPKGPLRYLVETAQERNEPIFPALIYSSGIIYPYVLVTAVKNSEEGTEMPTTSSASSSQPSNVPKKTTKVKRIPQKVQIETNVSSNPNQGETPVARVERERQPIVNVEPVQYVRHEDYQEEKGVKLGLGDFIFYSVLLGKASSYFDWNTTLACYVAILIGLCFTLVLLAVFKRALPALPISIFSGLIFYFCTRWIITPFVTKFTQNCLLY
ncbi:CBN-SEL-12 protein [Caenorhabditis brenneri]|uniref:Presenilin n=1 Tax=Caenorhabditis brenneri TaxID=135651 RepID=G0N7M3_CAEBE|nr:CBN-SEL-12 protein [Caenorhabditis brenneri]